MSNRLAPSLTPAYSSAHPNKEHGRFEQSRDLLEDAEQHHIQLWAPMVIQVEVTR